MVIIQVRYSKCNLQKQQPQIRISDQFDGTRSIINPFTKKIDMKLFKGINSKYNAGSVIERKAEDVMKLQPSRRYVVDTKDTDLWYTVKEYL